MKFARLLEYHTVPEWASYYVDYRLLKKLLVTYQNSISGGISEISESLLGNYDALKEYIMELEIQSSRINNFYIEKISDLRKDFRAVEEYIHNLKRVSTLNAEETLALLSMKERDDAQNRATSMERAFNELHTRINWLEEFCEINYIALLRVLNKFEPKNLKQVIDSMSFRGWEKELSDLKQKIYSMIAEECMQGDIQAATRLLTGTKRLKNLDIGIIGFCLGFYLIMLSVSGYMICNNDFQELSPSLCIFRLTFCMSLLIVLVGFMVFMLEKYDINWVYIFEIPPNKISYVEILRFGAVMLTFWQLILALHMSSVFYYPFISTNIVALGYVGVSLVLLLLPFNCFYRGARSEVLKLFVHLIIAPFGEIKFKNFMTGSWVTSLVIPLQDVYLICLFIISGSWMNNTLPQTSETVMLLLSILPFIWRILQNVKRVIYKRSLLLRQIQNFSRYIISIGLVVTAYLDFYSSIIWGLCFVLGVTVISALDVKQDWQLDLMHVNTSRAFPSKFYYFAIVSNYLLRFAGVACLLPRKAFHNEYLDTEVCIWILAVIELARRAQWAVIRIEREQNNNEENYRKVSHIPKITSNLVERHKL